MRGLFDLNRHLNEFDDWYVDVPFAEKTVRVLRCPEDRVCSHCDCATNRSLCENCSVPVCSTCYNYVQCKTPSLPPPPLCNGMMVFYAPEELYRKEGLAIMEMICASPCLTSMICLSMEVKNGNQFDSKLHMQRHRVGARGNATTCFISM